MARIMVRAAGALAIEEIAMQIGLAAKILRTIFVLLSLMVPPATFAVDETFFLASLIDGYEEVPTRSTTATARFSATLSGDGSALAYELVYSGFPTRVREAHIHLGRARVNGGIMVFLCTTTNASAPSGTPSCPLTAGTVTGTLTTSSVVGPADQGIAAGEFAEMIAALRASAGYVNIHTDAYPAGEIRNQVVPSTSGGTTDDDTNVQDAVQIEGGTSGSSRDRVSVDTGASTSGVRP